VLAVKPLGSLIAIGKPSEKLPTPGGYRLYEQEQDWQRAVIGLMQRARAVIVQASSTPGLIWEMGECREFVQPERLVILVHKLSKKDYEYFSMICSSRHHLLLPLYDRTVKRGGLIFFAPDWTASFHRLKAPSWRRPITRKLQAQFTHSLRPLFTACHITWKPYPFALVKVLMWASPALALLIGLGFGDGGDALMSALPFFILSFPTYFL
jgi:hypothetical protein